MKNYWASAAFTVVVVPPTYKAVVKAVWTNIRKGTATPVTAF